MDCANQAHQFETDWRRDNGSDFAFLMFRNHYNRTRANCYVHIYYGHSDLNMEVVYDALVACRGELVSMASGGGERQNISN